MNSESSRIIDK